MSFDDSMKQVAARKPRYRTRKDNRFTRGQPEVIATTLSDLTAEFSRELAQSIRESVKSSP
jgi:hypothetical protein